LNRFRRLVWINATESPSALPAKSQILPFAYSGKASRKDQGVATMSEEKKAEKTQVQILYDAFEGMKGRRPRSDQELNEWLATDEGKQATMFEPTLVSRWGETGHA
jgi:hypothetical protein